MPSRKTMRAAVDKFDEVNLVIGRVRVLVKHLVGDDAGDILTLGEVTQATIDDLEKTLQRVLGLPNE